MKNVLIIEPHMSGHHGVYLRWIVRGALERDFRVLIGTFEDSLTNPLFKIILQEFQDVLEIITLPTPAIDYMKDTSTGGLLRRELVYRKMFRKFYNKALRSFQLDRVFIPYLDYCTYAIAILGSPFGHTPWAGIVMRSAFHYKEMGIIGPNSRLLWSKKILFFRLLKQKSLRAMFTIDPTLDMYIKDKLPASAEKLHYLPDPADFDGNISKDAARQVLQIPQDAVVVLVYGTISLRKGIDALLTTVANQKALSNVHILLAGRQEPKEESLLQSTAAGQLLMSARLHQMNRFISDEDEYIVFKASDIVWLGYSGHYTMSGVIVQAGRMRLPVVACKEGVIGWLAKEHGLGIVIDGLNEKDISESVQKLMVSNSICIKYGESGKRHFCGHTVEQFVKTIFDALV
jgi:glycosyltransferase involved in cell wall biosynthesis